MDPVSYKAVNLVINQVYFLTSGHNNEEIEELFDKIKELLA